MSKATPATPAKKRSIPKSGRTSRKTVSGTAAVQAAEKAREKAASPPRNRPPRKSAKGFSIKPDERQHLIQVAAYYIAERRGFHGGSAHEDWLQAEREVDAMVAAGELAG